MNKHTQKYGVTLYTQKYGVTLCMQSDAMPSPVFPSCSVSVFVTNEGTDLLDRVFSSCCGRGYQGPSSQLNK
jgi:hypothetical protein